MQFITKYKSIKISSSIRDAAKIISHKKYQGLLIVNDEAGNFLGVLNDGDIIRAISKNEKLKTSINQFLNKTPITITKDDFDNNDFSKIGNQVFNRSGKKKFRLRFCPVLDKQKCIGLVDLFDIFDGIDLKNESIEIYGLGFVGLTLATHFASNGREISGFDIDSSLIRNLNKGKVSIHEEGLSEALSLCLKNKKIKFTSKLTNNNKVKIVCVGSAVNNVGGLNDNALKASCLAISKRLEFGDLVIFRSTVPIGFTRSKCVEWLSKHTNLVAGDDFSVAFCPERTAEGKALIELRELTQIIGGLTKRCSARAADFWKELSPDIKETQSLEAAELIKLANNSFRDFIFGFSNNLALTCAEYNIDSFDLVDAANSNYPRDKIPKPSPGVGGYCLTKDPLLFAMDKKNKFPQLSLLTRKANKESGKFPIKVIKNYCKFTKKKLQQLEILIIGIAFKGLPETNDLRGSDALELAKYYKNKVKSLRLLDHVVTDTEINQQGFKTDKKISSFKKYDAILILNNHPKNTNFNLSDKLKTDGIVFDGWKQLSKYSIEESGFYYSTMGYLSQKESS